MDYSYPMRPGTWCAYTQKDGVGTPRIIAESARGSKYGEFARQFKGQKDVMVHSTTQIATWYPDAYSKWLKERDRQ